MNTKADCGNPIYCVLRAWPLIAFALVLLFVLTAPIISLLLKTPDFDLPFSVQTLQVTCLPNTLCASMPKADYWRRDNSGYRMAIQLTQIDDLFEVAAWIRSGQLRVDAPNDHAIVLVPRYRAYANVHEVRRIVDADLVMSHEPPGELTISITFAQAPLLSATIETHKARLHLLDSTKEVWHHPRSRLILLASLIFFSGVAIVVDACLAAKLGDPGGLIASTTVARMVLLAAALKAGPLLAASLVAIALLVPMLLLPYWFGRHQIRSWLSNSASAERPPAEPTRRDELLWTGAASTTLAIFLFAMFRVPSFRWSIFEERDLLEAIGVVSRWPLLPVYGPELLAGGSTPGGGLYLLLSPIVKMWPTADALHFLNIVLFTGSAILVWLTVKYFSGTLAAAFALVAFVASERIIALSYWPIHPNFSIFFSLLYFFALIRGVVGACPGWLIASGIILGFLVQLHFSYFLLVPAHILIMFFRNKNISVVARSGAVFAFLLPLVPYLFVDLWNGFSNIAQISQQPRFHPASFSSAPLANEFLVPLTVGWLVALTRPLTLVVLALLTIGIAYCLFRSHKPNGDQGVVSVPIVALLFLCVPMTILTFMGKGYNTRHTLAVVPAVFILVGLGASVLVRSFRSRHRIPTIILLVLITVLAMRVGSYKLLERVAKSEGEWAVDFKDRQAIQSHLIETIRLTPSEYSQRAIWWWLGWSIDPAIYARAYDTHVGKGNQVGDRPTEKYWLITERKDLLPFLDHRFVSDSTEFVGSMYIHSARLRPEFADISPSGNSDTGVRLSEFLREVDLYRASSEGFRSVAEIKTRDHTATAYLGSTSDNRFKILISIIKERHGEQVSIRWCADSPTLNGHYQEIKTIWQAKLVARNERGKELFAVPLAQNVLGSLLYKTPRCGTRTILAADEPRFSFVYEGMFDQSVMSAPSIGSKEWPISETRATEDVSLKKSAEIWLKNRVAER
jgi:hypothetical protein